MRIAYADPPYFGYASFYKDDPRSAEWDSLDRHAQLVADLEREFPDGWALSMTSGNLWDILPLCPRPPRCRVAAWVKPFASFKKNVRVAYAWEPVILAGGRPRPEGDDTVRDWVSANATLMCGVVGAKPDRFCFWLFEALGMTPDDEFVDLFRGSGAVSKAHDSWRAQQRLPL